MTFPELLTGIRNLDDTALSIFMERYSPLIMAFMRKRVAANDAEDATQEFFYHILKVNLFAKFGGETEDALKAYLVKSALYFCYDWRKKEFDLQKSLEVFDGDNPAHWSVLQGGDVVHEEFIKKETSARLNEAIGNLGEQYRKVIELKLLGYSNPEIAGLLEEPLGSVNTWYSRGLRILGDHLKELHTEVAKSGVLK